MNRAALIQVRVDGTERTISFARQHINDVVSARQISWELGELIDQNDLSSDQEDRMEVLNLDFQEIDWLSSVGLNQLIGINSKARANGVRLVLTNVQENVRKVFRLTRLERMFDLAEMAAAESGSESLS